MTRSKKIRNGTIAALAGVIVTIIIQQNRDPDSPLSRWERENVSEFRSRANRAIGKTKRAKDGTDEVQVKAMMGLIKLLGQRGHSTKKLSPYLYRLLRRKLAGMDSAMAEALMEEFSALADQKDE